MHLERDLPTLRRIHRQRVAAGAARDTIDDSTWSDLDLDELLADVDHCHSVLGQLTLCEWLRAPAQTLEELQVRERRLEPEPMLRAGLLERLRRFPPLLAETLWEAKQLPTLGALPTVLASIAVAAHLLFLISTQVGFLAMLSAFLVNMAFHFWSQPRIEAAVASLEFISVLLLAGQTLLTRANGRPSTRTLRVAALMKQLRPLRRAVAQVTVPPVLDDFPAEHLRILYQTRQRRLSRSARLIEEHRAALIELIALLGELDASASVADYKAKRATCVPQLKPESSPLELTLARHPSVPNAVANSLTLSGGVVITGSNMSGKSTFLRTVAVNALLAQSLGLACAASYRGPLLRIATSLRNGDRLSMGESTYFAEAKRMRELLALTGSSNPLLLLVDEPFRGTNSAERIAAGAAVLRYAREQGALVLAATHDLELSQLLSETFDQAHFLDVVSDGGLSFDYRLRPGLVGPRNAVKLLEAMGYPASVIAEAKRLLG